MEVSACLPTRIRQLLRGFANRLSEEFAPETAGYEREKPQTPVQVRLRRTGRIRCSGGVWICTVKTTRTARCREQSAVQGLAHYDNSSAVSCLFRDEFDLHITLIALWREDNTSGA